MSFRRLPHMVMMMHSVQKLCHIRFSQSVSVGQVACHDPTLAAVLSH
ncbi:hypothetical protein ACVBKF_14715 [Shewanella sp. 0m-11]